MKVDPDVKAAAQIDRAISAAPQGEDPRVCDCETCRALRILRRDVIEPLERENAKLREALVEATGTIQNRADNVRRLCLQDKSHDHAELRSLQALLERLDAVIARAALDPSSTGTS